MEWPAKSGRMREFPETDRAQWFSVDEARHKIAKGQIPIVDALAQWFQ
jgi:predicted NUDIX family NTP pyrophosphohydrolase